MPTMQKASISKIRTYTRSIANLSHVKSSIMFRRLPMSSMVQINYESISAHASRLASEIDLSGGELWHCTCTNPIQPEVLITLIQNLLHACTSLGVNFTLEADFLNTEAHATHETLEATPLRPTTLRTPDNYSYSTQHGY